MCRALPSAQTGGNDKRKQKIIIVILMMPSGRQSDTGYVEVYEGSSQEVLFLSSHHSFASQHLSVVLWENLIISVGLQLFFVEIAAWKILIVLSNLTFPALAFCLIKMLLSLWSWLVTTRVLCNYANYIRLKLKLINPLTTITTPVKFNCTNIIPMAFSYFLKQSYSIHEIKDDFSSVEDHH